MIVTHNLQQAHRIADHVAFMYLGELVEYGAGRADLRFAPRTPHAGVREWGLRMTRRDRASGRCGLGRRGVDGMRVHAGQERPHRARGRRSEAGGEGPRRGASEPRGEGGPHGAAAGRKRRGRRGGDAQPHGQAAHERAGHLRRSRPPGAKRVPKRRGGPRAVADRCAAAARARHPVVGQRPGSAARARAERARPHGRRPQRGEANPADRRVAPSPPAGSRARASRPTAR